MPTESSILQGLDQEDQEIDPKTDAATDATERSQGKVPDDADTTELDDGGAIIRMQDAKDVKKAEEFYANLAEGMPQSDLREIANKILDLLDKDIVAREDRDKQYDEGLRRTGFSKDSPGGASFDGASRVVHPLMAEVAIDFSARAIKELWPAGGPVKDDIVGEPSAKKEAKAKRKVRYMNWQMTKKLPSWRYEMEQILTQVPMGGVQYSKLYQDVKRKRPVHEPVWVDEVILPFAATDWYSSPRKAHIQKLDEYTFDDRVRSGMYRDVDTIKLVTQPDETRTERTSNKIEGKTATNFNEDGIRVVFEVDIQYLIPDSFRKISDPDDTDEGPAPYLISIDKDTRDVLSIYRNWDQDDKTLEPLQHIIEWPMLPWRGAMAIGLPQMLGGIAAAATGALRALLDSALINNFPGGVHLKSGPVGGQSVRVESGQTNEIDGGVLQDDIRKTFMPVPVNPTSQALFQLLEFLVQSGKELINTTLDEAEDNANVPVGTIMARIEQQMVVFSAIHSRLHHSMGRLLRVLHRLNATYLDDEQVVEETGEQMVWKADFDAPEDVIPVSDPEIFSELQRIAQTQAIAARAEKYPTLYDQYAVEEDILSMMKVKNSKKYLIPKPVPKPMNAVNENIAAALGQPIVAFPDQDHLAHIQTHLSFLEDPLFGGSPGMVGTVTPLLLQNIKEHMLFYYANAIIEKASGAAGQDITEFMTIKDTEVQTKFDGLLAAATISVHPEMQKVFSSVPAVLQKAQQLLQQSQPPQPMDPSVVAQNKIQSDAQAAQAKLAQQAQNDAEVNSLKKADMAQQAQLNQTDQQITAQSKIADHQSAQTIAGMNNDGRQRVVQSQNATKLEVTAEDNRVAEEIASAEIAAGHSTQIKNGQAVGKKPGTL